MKITIINQHTSNRGDEAAAKALLRAIKKYSDLIESIDIVYNRQNILKKDDEISIEGLSISHHSSGNFMLVDKLIMMATFLFPFQLAKILIKFSNWQDELKLMEKADVIISSPCGVNMGLYQDWHYLWRLFVSVKLNKKVAIYSTSFGFVESKRFNFLSYLFNKVSMYVLNHIDFQSYRDSKSQELAKSLKLNYIDSIDTVFLDSYYESDLPDNLKFLNNMDYVVCVTNELYNWHPNFKNIKTDKLDKIYVNIIDNFLNKNISVILLPQLFGLVNDEKYCSLLREKSCDKSNVYVIPELTNSDIHQCIIKKSIFVIGGRYHSSVFAIRNSIPFVCLSYEHKMEYMLSILNLSFLNIDLNSIIKGNLDYMDKINKYFDSKDIINIADARKKAISIANNTFSVFCKDFLFK